MPFVTVPSFFSHQRRFSNVLFAAEHVTTLVNQEDLSTVDVGTIPMDGLKRILTMFKLADEYR